jgi:hypothetical protein
MQSGYYGAVYSSYWTGLTGRAIQEQGGVEAALLGLYLLTSPYSNMIGLYEQPPSALAADTSISPAAIPGALEVLAATDFARYDAASRVVWVPTMARARLRLTDERPKLVPGDKLIVAVNRCYAAVIDNPFLGVFYERNRDTLGLNRLRSGAGTPQQLRLELLIAAPTGSTYTGTGKSTGAPRRRLHAVENRRRRYQQPSYASFGLYALIAGESIIKASLEDHDDSVSNVSAHFKQLCADRHIDYTGDIASKAIAAAIVGQRRRRA